jgi:hypothetical protein
MYACTPEIKVLGNDSKSQKNSFFSKKRKNYITLAYVTNYKTLLFSF